MKTIKRTPEAEALTELILTLFRANSVVMTWGDRIVGPLGLTSARWQILGAMVAADRPQPVAWYARDLSANRQNIQRIVNDLERDGLVVFQPNPHHRRAQLVALTDKGKETFDAAIRRYNPLINKISKKFTIKDVQTAHQIVAELRNTIEGGSAHEEQS
ncbi:MarR family transcriptional regulator [Ralstonia solanacearum]|uniref:MarR family transcriptional regulator n=1 Tax=Ralstonia solanacearum TaxID=305 RepID=A0AAW5ZWF9_RALSL|nr:MarR family transcriptional regulator [Ralstonia solanacearum]MDB0573938.1 MarR family transcriptional regulator [Ralstonia solanacearum]